MMDLMDRIFPHLQWEGDCLIWTRSAAHGYGQLCWREGGKRFSARVHRLVYELTVGPLDSRAVFVCHACDNPPCCNPEHLHPGTSGVNQLESVERGRHGQARKTHCKHGHEFTEQNTYIDPKGNRVCRKCRNDRARAAWARCLPSAG